jgi:hypothetical protein
VDIDELRRAGYIGNPQEKLIAASVRFLLSDAGYWAERAVITMILASNRAQAQLVSIVRVGSFGDQIEGFSRTSTTSRALQKFEFIWDPRKGRSLWVQRLQPN